MQNIVSTDYSSLLVEQPERRKQIEDYLARGEWALALPLARNDVYGAFELVKWIEDKIKAEKP